jgi:hypothetical protein
VSRKIAISQLDSSEASTIRGKHDQATHPLRIFEGPLGPLNVSVHALEVPAGPEVSHSAAVPGIWNHTTFKLEVHLHLGVIAAHEPQRIA